MSNSFKTISKNTLEGIIDIARVNLFFPRIGFDNKVIFTELDGTKWIGGDYPKGVPQTIIADVALSAYLGSQSHDQTIIACSIIAGVVYPLVSGFFGMLLSKKVDYLKKKYKENHHEKNIMS